MKFISICKIWFLSLLIFSIFMFYNSLNYIMSDYSIFIEFEIITVNSMSVVMTLLFDWMSLIFMSFVLLISSLVILYSKEYMEGDCNINRFIMLVLLFVLSMMLLIISPNLISILLGWDGLGLVSYCLVIYFQNIKSYNAGMLTVLSNRIGDVALLLSIAWMLNMGGWNYIFYLEVMINCSYMSIIGGLILLAAMTKSAQIPFSSWLPAAMAAPTPVSALVHSSTLVTAGVYLLIRFNLMFSICWLSNFLLFMSSLTMFMSGLGANYEFDLKKIIALSTLSQLGLMMSILALGYWKLAFFHLLSHALFKALLFMCAGAIIHNLNNSQDIRLMGNLSLIMPLSSMYFNVANLALCGMPFLAGFYSKDLILEMVFISYMNFFYFILFIISTSLTVCYSFRLVFYTMFMNFNFFSLNMLKDEGWVMLNSMMVLTVMSVVGGSLLSWVIFPTPLVIILPLSLKLLIIIICMIGGLLGYLMSKIKNFNCSLNFYYIFGFLGEMWFMPYLMTYGIVKFPLLIGKFTEKIYEQGWNEFMGGQHLYKNLSQASMFNEKLQNNNLKIYLLSFGIWFFILWFYL